MTDRPVLLAPKGMLERKPPHGRPCNGCGLCCIATQCELSRHVFGERVGSCPALYSGANGFACALADLEERGNAAKTLIGAGTGCDARFNGEPTDQGFYLTLAKWDHDNAEAIRDARRIWGMPVAPEMCTFPDCTGGDTSHEAFKSCRRCRIIP